MAAALTLCSCTHSSKYSHNPPLPTAGPGMGCTLGAVSEHLTPLCVYALSNCRRKNCLMNSHRQIQTWQIKAKKLANILIEISAEWLALLEVNLQEIKFLKSLRATCFGLLPLVLQSSIHLICATYSFSKNELTGKVLWQNCFKAQDLGQSVQKQDQSQK